ncbi:site-specific integrase [uncultured Sneathiella sp.]|uniref:tyrosine-type recombinase/integrase n=1 Tax=uncultured Sneathiella sp. TaxID=879315 RepID=UPI002598ECED|nr:site-specific integrase [uncultured Sneathiella sp.]
MAEYNPKNEMVKKQYEEALLHGKYRDPKTVKAVWSSINSFEAFTGYIDFKDVTTDHVKAFKMSLEHEKNKSGELLSISTIRSTLGNLKEFFEWLAMHPQFIKKVDGRITQYFRLSDNANRASRASREKTPPTLAELEMTLKAMPYGTDIEKRDRAMFAFVIITCIRDDALVSLKRKDVDANKRTVWQDPRHVRTKRRKGIMTRFLGEPMPLAEKIVMDWLKFLVDVFEIKPNEPLFPKTLMRNNPETMAFEAQGLSREHYANAGQVRDIFKAAFTAVGLPYYNPHLIRNTIVKWALKNMSQFEFTALSQNIGHEHVMTTYNPYGKLSEDEQIEAIENIGSKNPELQNVSTDKLLAEVGRRTQQ